MCCEFMHCLDVDSAFSILVSVGFLFHDVERHVERGMVNAFPLHQCLGTEACCVGLVERWSCYAEQ